MLAAGAFGRSFASRFLLALISLWIAISILFLLLEVVPGDWLTEKLTNLENQGAELRETEVIGEIVVGVTGRVAERGDTFDEIAAREDISVDELLRLNPGRDPGEPLEQEASLVVLEGEWLADIVVNYRLVRPENAEEGVELLRRHNPDIEFPTRNGQPYASSGIVLTLHDGITVSELAYAYRISAADIIEANPPGELFADTVLRHGDLVVLPSSRITSEAIRHQLGLNASLINRYGTFLWDTVRFDFGESFQTRENALSIVARALPRTVQLNIFVLIVSLAVGVPLGLLAAGRASGRAAALARGLAALMIAVPSFWLALILAALVTPLGWFESGLWVIPLADESALDITSSPSGFFALYSLPAISGGLLLAGAIALTIGRARRDRPNAVVRPLVRAGRDYLPIVIGLNIVLEASYNIPGFGLFLLQRLNQVDMPVVTAIACVYALFVVWWFFICDGATMALGRRERPV